MKIHDLSTEEKISVGKADDCVAATALENGLAVATRDTNRFPSTGLNVIIPWYASA